LPSGTGAFLALSSIRFSINASELEGREGIGRTMDENVGGGARNLGE